jgi:hypothetical protein
MSRPSESVSYALNPDMGHGGLGVVLVPGAREQLSKAQLAFKRLVTRIEKLRRKIDLETERLTGQLEFYSAEIRPLELAAATERKTFVRLLYPFLSGPSLGRRKGKTMLRSLIQEQLIGIMDAFGKLEEDDLREIFEEIEGKSLKEFEAEDFETMKEGLGEMLGSMGVNADLSGMRPGMSDAEMAAQMAELRAQIEAQKATEAAGNVRPKTARQLEKEAREQAAEELRKRDVGGLYRQLAKLLHPDLEQDPVLKAEKEAAMKELTTAYKNDDLHAMLRLEVAWMAREQADAGRLTDQKLKIYNKVLKEQVAELEDELAAVGTHPRFQPLMRFVDPFFGDMNFHGPSEKRNLQSILKGLKKSIVALRGPRAAEEVAALVEAYVPDDLPPMFWK